MYGCGTIFVTPGHDFPATAAFFTTSRAEGGQIFREPIMFAVRFQNGEAEVGDELGAYLVKKGMASSRRPWSIPVPHHLADVGHGRPMYSSPIAVGRPLTPEGGEPPPAPPTLLERCRRNVRNIAAAMARRM